MVEKKIHIHILLRNSAMCIFGGQKVFISGVSTVFFSILYP